MKVYKRALGAKAASRCENAKTPTCKCRCGGLLHGKGRTSAAGGPASLFDLPRTDPHHPQFKGETVQRELAI